MLHSRPLLIVPDDSTLVVAAETVADVASFLAVFSFTLSPAITGCLLGPTTGNVLGCGACCGWLLLCLADVFSILGPGNLPTVMGNASTSTVVIADEDAFTRSQSCIASSRWPCPLPLPLPVPLPLAASS